MQSKDQAAAPYPPFTIRHSLFAIPQSDGADVPPVVGLGVVSGTPEAVETHRIGIGAQAQILDVPDAGASSAFIATATDVYWVHGATSRVYRAQLPHGAPQLVFDDFNPGEPMALAADGAFLYIARRVTGDIVRCPLAGCSPVHVFETVIDNQAQPVSLSIYGSVLYWTTLGTGPGTGTANKCSPQGLQCAATKVSIAQALDGPTGILCDGFGVYWGTSGIVTSGWVQRADP